MKKLIIVFVLLLSALSCFSQIEFSTCLFDASRNRSDTASRLSAAQSEFENKSHYI